MLLGVAGAFLATWLGQTIGWYHAGEGAGLIGAVVGAVIILIAYRMFKAAAPPERPAGLRRRIRR